MLNNKIIVESPVILFLGAGASALLRKPMMAEFVKKVAEGIRAQDQKEMLDLLRKFRGDDLEQILGELDAIIDLDYALGVHGMVEVAGAIRVAGTDNYRQFDLPRDVAIRLRTNIKHDIIREYRSVNPAKVAEIYRPLFDIVFLNAPKGAWLPVFTTNYDPAIEEFCRVEFPKYELCDGFIYDAADRQHRWNRSCFDDFGGQPGKRNLILFKLHGSADWLVDKANGLIRRGQAMFDLMDSDAYGNILIYPATRKIATEDPFYTGYEYFERCCERARLCIAIGYSFRDYDALTRLRGAMSVNENFQLLLIGPSAPQVLANIPIPEERKVPLSLRFGEKADDLGVLGKYILETLTARKP